MRAAPVVKTHRTHRRIQSHAQAETTLDATRTQARIPGAAPIREQRALNFFGKRETIFKRAENHSVAAKLVVAIAAQATLPAEPELIELRHIAASEAVHAAQCPNLVVVARFDVVLMFNRSFLIFEVAAQYSAEFQRQIDLVARRRRVNVVAGVGDVFEDNRARRAEIFTPPIFVFGSGAVAGIAAGNVTDVFVFAVAERDIVRRIFADGSAESQFAAAVFAHVLFLEVAARIVVVVGVGAVVQLEAERGLFAVKPRVPVGESVAVSVGFAAALFVHDGNRVARAAKVRVAYGYHADNAVGRGIARAYAESARAFFLDVNFHDNRIGLDAGVHFDVDILEEAQVVDALHGTARQLRIERRTDFLAHFAKNDLVLSLRVAFDRVALQNAFVNLERQDAFLVYVHIGYLHEDEAFLVVILLNRRDVVVQGVAVENFAAPHRHELVKLFLGIKRVARVDDIFKHGIFKHVEGYDDAFGDCLESLISLVEIARV